jgi:hypothetical protein
MVATHLEPGSLDEALERWVAGALTPPDALATPAEVAAVRDELESAAAHAVAAAGDDADLASNPIRLSKRRITELAACERHLVATFGAPSGGGPDGDEALHLGVLVDVLAEHHVLTGRPRPDAEPLALGEELCRAHGDKEATIDWLASLAPDARRAVEERLDEKRGLLLGGWPAFDPAWWPRTQERVVVGLAGGQVVLDGRADVVVGGAPTRWPAVVIEVKSGEFSREQRDDGLFYGLLVALRDGVAPAAAITTTPSAIHVERATADRLRTASLRLAAAVEAAGELAGGRPPAERPGPRCRRCPDAGSCPSGRTWLASAEAAS